MFFNFLLIEGIEVGYQFYSRAEMVAVGFHHHWLNGIDYMGQSYTKMVIQLFFVLFLHISLILNIISNRF
jgi:hypothetical protein